MIFVLVVLFFIFVKYIPYLNLLLSYTYLTKLLLIVLAPIVLKIEAKVMFILAIAIFFLVFLLWVLGRIEESEILTEYVFIFIFAGSIRSFATSK